MERKITLSHPVLGDRVFEYKHGQRILKMKNNGGWYVKSRTNKGAKEEPKEQE